MIQPVLILGLGPDDLILGKTTEKNRQTLLLENFVYSNE
jgi:hypothetical protein